jgi:hypothetical protein
MSADPKTRDQTRSKIMRLPFEDRMAFNRMVRDRYKASVLAKWLADHGIPNVNAQNISKYRHSKHYKQWLREEADMDREREETERAMRLAEALGGCASQKIKSILAGKLYLFGRNLADPDDLKQFVAAFNSVTNAEELELKNRQVQQRDRQIEIREKEFERRTCELFLDWVKDKFAREIAENAALDNAAKIEALREHYFADVDAMQKSGKVVLPE